jgi:S1-C subfamily serine protease
MQGDAASQRQAGDGPGCETNKRHPFGSTFIITADGYVVTNKHVTCNGISYTVTLHDGREVPANLVAEAFAFDIAVLKIRRTGFGTRCGSATVRNFAKAISQSPFEIRSATKER